MDTGSRELELSSSNFPGHQQQVDQKWNSQDMSERPYEMPESQVMTLPPANAYSETSCFKNDFMDYGL